MSTTKNNNNFKYVKKQNNFNDLLLFIFFLSVSFSFGVFLSSLFYSKQECDDLSVKKQLAICEEISAIEAEKYGVCRNLLTLIKVYEEQE